MRKACDKAIAALARGEQPRNETTLDTRLQRDQKTLRHGTADRPACATD